MVIVSLSLTVRVLVDAEALNMAESVGNYTRHRKVPVVTASPQGYHVIYAPAVSGEALAHGYQQLLAQVAKERGLPVTQLDEQGYFLKFPRADLLNWYPELAKYAGKSDIASWAKAVELGDLEKTILKTSVVADVGGFLLADRLLKRTSAIRFSYMVPTLDAIEAGGVALTPQLHVRYAPPPRTPEEAEVWRRQGVEPRALFYVESGSALYTFSAQLVASDIGKLYYSQSKDPDLERERMKRVEAAVDALIALVDGMLFGAKRSRYMPLWSVKSLAVALNKGPVEFTVSPGITKNYVKETYERAVALTKALSEETVNIYVYNAEDLPEPAIRQDVKNVTYTKTTSHTSALIEAKTRLLNIMSVLSMVS